MRLRTILSEALRSLSATMSTTVAATLTVLVGMFVLGLTIGLGTWVLSWSDHVKKQLHLKVDFCVEGYDACTRTANAADVALVRRYLVQAKRDGRVRTYEFISREEALKRMKKQHPKIVGLLATNPLPAAYDITPVKAEYNAGIKRDIQSLGPNGTKPAGVDVVHDGGETSRRVLKVGSIIELVFLVGLIVLLVASTLLIANTIRLSIFARRREIEVMKLVGATNWFVRGPFMIEGLLCGIVGSVAAILLLLIGKEVVLPAILGHIEGSSDVHALSFELQALAILGAGLLLGAAGSGLTLRRFLRV